MEPENDEDFEAIPLERVANLQEFRKNERMICVICHNLLVRPAKCSQCFLHFCQDCISQWTKKNNTCPNCRSAFKSEKVERTLKEDIEDTKIICVYKSSGCSEIVNYEKIWQHQKSCDYKPTTCQWCKNMKGNKKEVNIHEQNCEARCIQCLGCLQNISFKVFDQHENPCLKNAITTMSKQIKDLKDSKVKKQQRKIKFSQNLLYRDEGVQIIGDAVAKMNFDEFQKNAVVLMKPKLKNKTVCWKIKIRKLTCWIGLGVGNGNLLTKTKLNLTDAQIENMRHGSYMISNNGLSWSCDIKSENFIQNYQFNTGDIITILYSPEKLELRFLKNDQFEKVLRMSQNFLSQISGNIYPIAVLGGVNDSIEILESKFE